jgi:hypothetical protein
MYLSRNVIMYLEKESINLLQETDYSEKKRLFKLTHNFYLTV